MKTKEGSSPRLDYVICVIPALILGMSTYVALDWGSWIAPTLLLAGLTAMWHYLVSGYILRDPEIYETDTSPSGPQMAKAFTLWHNMLGRGVTSFLFMAAFGPLFSFALLEPFFPFLFQSSVTGFIVAGAGFLGWEIRIYCEMKQWQKRPTQKPRE